MKLTFGAPAAREKCIPDIYRVRAAIALVDPTGDLAFGPVGVWGSHTHWHGKKVLVEEIHEKGYFLRVLRRKPKGRLLGISFMVKKGKLIVGEYASESVFTQQMLEEYPAILLLLKKVAQHVGNAEAGVTLLHRFKPSFYSKNVPTAEHLPTEEGTLITRHEDFAGNVETLETVIWTAYNYTLYLPKWLHGFMWLLKLGRQEVF